MIQIALALVVVVTVISVWRSRQRRASIRSAAPFHGFRSLGDANPFLAEATACARGKPHLLADLAEGRAVVRNVIQAETPAGEAFVFDARFPRSNHAGTGPFTTVVAFRTPGIPDFQLTRRIRFIFGVETVAFPSDPEFTRRFTLMANDEPSVRRAFGAPTLAAFAALAEKKEWHVQAGSGWLLIGYGLARPEALSELVRQGAEVAVAISRSSPTAPLA